MWHRFWPSDLLPRINPVGFLTLPGHSGRASLRGISAPVVHISFCVRAVIATAFCQDANITTAITCVLSLGKNLTYHAARFLVCTRDKYYTAIQQINVSINRQYGIHPTAKDRGLSACYDRNRTIRSSVRTRLWRVCRKNHPRRMDYGKNTLPITPWNEGYFCIFTYFFGARFSFRCSFE